MNPQGYDTRLDDQELKPRIEDTLNHALMLFKDGKELRKKYGLKPVQGCQKVSVGAATSLSTVINSAWATASLSQRFQRV
jgi:hypothetical protein